MSTESGMSRRGQTSGIIRPWEGRELSVLRSPLPFPILLTQSLDTATKLDKELRDLARRLYVIHLAIEGFVVDEQNYTVSCGDQTVRDANSCKSFLSHLLALFFFQRTCARALSLSVKGICNDAIDRCAVRQAYVKLQKRRNCIVSGTSRFLPSLAWEPGFLQCYAEYTAAQTQKEFEEEFEAALHAKDAGVLMEVVTEHFKMFEGQKNNLLHQISCAAEGRPNIEEQGRSIDNCLVSRDYEMQDRHAQTCRCALRPAPLRSLTPPRRRASS